jgi:hypothetical protein
LSLWAKRTAQNLNLTSRWRNLAVAATPVLALSSVILPSGVLEVSALSAERQSRPLKAVANEIAASGTAVRIADTTGPFTFHAHAESVWLPYCDELTALRYLERMGVTHVVVRSSQGGSRPYLAKWIQKGVPDAHEVSHVIAAGGETIRVYALRRG